MLGSKEFIIVEDIKNGRILFRTFKHYADAFRP